MSIESNSVLVELFNIVNRWQWNQEFLRLVTVHSVSQQYTDCRHLLCCLLCDFTPNPCVRNLNWYAGEGVLGTEWIFHDLELADPEEFTAGVPDSSFTASVSGDVFLFAKSRPQRNVTWLVLLNGWRASPSSILLRALSIQYHEFQYLSVYFVFSAHRLSTA